ncbi:hypothetical protein LS482_04735 [Sinomicrobium kalidii]|uniref:hypothetical protein n=1 Tax=Sinomicrobium kalidii TaxID=2900738 RepID=UPI001E611879|nr:hypothetical protein [Sinomicrobium kalidii]UGU17179.1 hypothetical protein LS482_04735 [Sinomicrobium kalidii]
MNPTLSHTKSEKEKYAAGFTLNNVMTIQIGKWYILWGIVVIISFFGIKVFLGDVLRIIQSPYSFVLVLALFFAGIRLIQKKYLKKSIRFFINKDTVKVIYNDVDEYIRPIDDLKAVRTLHHSNKKGDIQAEFFFRGEKINLTSAINHTGKEQLDAFCLYCQKKLGFVEGNVPFSIWTHNWQGVKYVEYKNPNYHE